MAVDRDDLIRAGLYDPAGPDSGERLELLEYLAAEGLTIEEMAEADRETRLTVAAVEPMLRGGSERLTLAEVCQRAGVDTEIARRTWLADGFPDPGDAPIFSVADVAIFPTIQAAVEAFGEATFLDLARVLGSSVARIAEAEVAAFAATVAAPLVRDVAVARATVEVAQLLPMVDRVIARLHRHHIQAAIRRLAYTVEGLGLQPAATAMAIGFADLAGYTAMSGQLTIEELSGLLARFNAAATDTVTAAGGRVVKLIGDEVMFVTPSPSAACGIAVALRRTVETLPGALPLRIGLAYGTVLTRDGDYYGTTVNTAARAAAAAGAGRTLVDRALRDAVAGDTDLPFRDAGMFAVAGFEGPVRLYQLDEQGPGHPPKRHDGS